MARGILGKALRGAAPVAAQWAEMSYKEDMAEKRQERLLELSEGKTIAAEKRAETTQIAKEGRAEETAIRKEGRKTTTLDDTAAFYFEHGIAGTKQEAAKMAATAGKKDSAAILSIAATKAQADSGIVAGDKNYIDPFDMYERFKTGRKGGDVTPPPEVTPPPADDTGLIEKVGGFVSDITSRAQDRPRRTRGGTTAPKAEPPSALEEARAVIDRSQVKGGGRTPRRPPSVKQMDLIIDNNLSTNSDMSEREVYRKLLEEDTPRTLAVRKRVRQRLEALGR